MDAKSIFVLQIARVILPVHCLISSCHTKSNQLLDSLFPWSICSDFQKTKTELKSENIM